MRQKINETPTTLKGLQATKASNPFEKIDQQMN
jgi:hypothetical protein